jgi:alkanesulfonate monooxygenase SsuD/methylene tetrahydromethanopterin reductase-like flavin-dependent oxidoreductase (luciferase family)
MRPTSPFLLPSLNLGEAALGYALRHIRKGQQRAGAGARPLDTVLWLHTAISEDGAQARDAVRKIVVGVLVSSLPVLDVLGVTLPADLRELIGSITYEVQSEEMSAAAQLVPDTILEHFTMAGNGEFSRRRVAEVARAGGTHIAVLPWLVPGQTIEAFITTFAREVIHRADA